jgi:hypothetical protein
MKKDKKISDRSRLVKKHLEHVDWKLYREALGKKERGRGIYVLYKGDEVYYIGLSKCSLRSRLRRHASRDRHKGKWDNFSFFQIGRTKYIKDTESLLLKIFKPRGNKMLGRFKKKYDLARRKKPNAPKH